MKKGKNCKKATFVGVNLKTKCKFRVNVHIFAWIFVGREEGNDFPRKYKIDNLW